MLDLTPRPITRRDLRRYRRPPWYVTPWLVLRLLARGEL